MKTSPLVVFFLFLSLFYSCMSVKKTDNAKMMSIQLIDRHGFNETISSEDRLKLYEETDFLQSQSYSKVIRLFARGKQAQTKSIVTSYHDNGQIFQYLEVENGRAHGLYKEWYSSGQIKIIAHILEGIGDVNENCMTSWVFDKDCVAYDESGHLLAKILYDKGDLNGTSTYYYPSKIIKKTTPYMKNMIHGEELYFDEEGNKVGSFHYKYGVKDGLCVYLGSKVSPKFTEQYQEGKLIFGKYFDDKENVISLIQNGEGIQTIYDHGVIFKQLEFKKGIQNGKVYIYNKLGLLDNEYTAKDGLKHGEEYVYYLSKDNKERKAKLYVNWYEGKIQGRVRTWYENGQLESEKEMHDSQKNGVATAWYKDGSVMLIEEYEKDLLMKGTYMHPKEKTALSSIDNGNGIATLYDADGHFIKRVEYCKGIPVEH